MRMEDWKLWNSERSLGELVEASWWELTMLLGFLLGYRVIGKGERFSGADLSDSR